LQLQISRTTSADLDNLRSVKSLVGLLIRLVSHSKWWVRLTDLIFRHIITVNKPNWSDDPPKFTCCWTDNCSVGQIASSICRPGPIYINSIRPTYVFIDSLNRIHHRIVLNESYIPLEEHGADVHVSLVLTIHSCCLGLLGAMYEQQQKHRNVRYGTCKNVLG
jgi:hypothetical protein